MKKSFYCIFGAQHTVDELVEILQKNFDMEFIPHDSSYLGRYLKYSGIFADKIAIMENKVDTAGDWVEERFKEYPTIINLSNINGKNSDKLSKTNYLKKQFSRIPDIVLLEENVFEE